MKKQKNYEKEYHLKRHNYLHEDENYYMARAKVAREQYFKDTVKTKEKVLEYGCGLGQNISLINGAVGYDNSKFASNFCNKKGINIIKSIKEIKDGSFDVVLCCEVLEHVEQPLKILKEINSKLKKGGRLILVLPIEKEKQPQPSDFNQHLYSWKPQSITNLLLRVGFYPINYKTLRRTGFRKWLFLSKAGFFRLYLFFTWLSAIIFGSKHMRIISIKK